MNDAPTHAASLTATFNGATALSTTALPASAMARGGLLDLAVVDYIAASRERLGEDASACLATIASAYRAGADAQFETVTMSGLFGARTERQGEKMQRLLEQTLLGVRSSCPLAMSEARAAFIEGAKMEERIRSLDTAKALRR